MAPNWLLLCLLLPLFNIDNARAIDINMAVNQGELQGPLFIHEPTHHVDFSNSTGTRLECTARGNPTPTIRWLLSDNSQALPVDRVRSVFDNGTLIFPPFRAEDYRQDVHAAIYRCTASNPLGTIVSKEVRLRAVVKQVYEVQVYDEYVIQGNTAVLRCHIPSFVIDYVVVTSWVRDMAFNIHTTVETGGQYMMMPTGELHVRDVTLAESYKSYRCKTTHRLTGETKLSSTFGKLIVTDPRGTVQPRITDTKQIVTARQGERVALPCAAQGYPIPFYSWYTKPSIGQLLPLTITDNIRQISGTLILTTVHVSDSATYVCVANNSVGSERVETSLTVTVPLSAYIKPAAQTIDIGKPANFTCVISGVPVRKVVWFKNGQSVVSNDHFRLTARDYLQIVSVKREDKGMYQCHVKNDMEYVQATGELRLGDAVPEMITKFQEQTVQPGSSVSLQCVVAGNPPPQISWTIHGAPVPIEPGFSTGTVISLTGDVVGSFNISHTRTEDGGEYRCNARNRAGDVEHAAKLNVYGRPYIRPMPKLSIVDGETMNIKCPVSGYPIDSITWEKDGMTLPVNHRQEVHKNGTLMITNVQLLTDSGRYSCVARNQQGHTARRDLEVKVMAPPKIIPFSFQDDELSEGMRAQISCAVRQGEQPITIHWLKDGFPIGVQSGGGISSSAGSSSSGSSSGGVVVRNFDEFTSILRIEAVRVRHNGNYTCVASNAAAAVNYTARLRVNVPPLLTPLSFQDDHLYEGAHARVTCGVRRGDLPITFTWLKDGLPIPAGTGVAIREVDEYSSILTISHVAQHHSGNYTCTVSNAAASVGYTAELTVNVAPQWTTEPQDTAVLVGSRIRIDCSATGFPRPAITWKKAVGNSPGKYQELPYGLNGIVQHSNGTLAFVQASEADRGYYLCQASNGIGAGLSKVVFFNVHIPARFDVRSHNQTVKRGQKATLSCQASGDEPTTITWNVNQQQISSANPRYKIQDISRPNGMTSELIIAHAERADSATYLCQVSNRYGQDEASVHLMVQEAPDAPRNVRVLDQSKRSMQITWGEPYNGNSFIQRYILQYKKSTDTWQLESHNATVSGSQTLFTISSLLPASVYNVRIFAENELGISEASEVITVTTSEEVPTGPPQKVKVDAVDSNTLKVSWKPPRKELWNGNIQGYYVGYKVYDSTEPYIFSTVEVNERSGEELQLHLTNLLKFMRYGIVVQSFNRLGPGPKSDEVVALTSEDVPDKPPTDVQCTTVSAQSLHVGWESPPTSALNGVLQGYKVLYAPVHEWNEVGNKETKITTALKTTLHGLERNTNYSIQLLAFTRVGDGVKSDSVFCQTNEDVPDAPADIKAALMSQDSILVVWKAPNKPNGVITKYTVYIRAIHHDSKDETTKQTVLATQRLRYEATNLKLERRFDFWVTASTTIGEGQSTRVVSQTTGTKVSARIVSFNDRVVLAWKNDVTLACNAVGAPAPEKEWKTHNTPLQTNERIRLQDDGSLTITNIQSSDAGNYTCRVQNVYGSDDITYNLTVLAPPSTPTLFLSATSLTSIQVKWRSANNGGSPIRSHTLHYKRDYGEWEEVKVAPERDTYTLDNLWCGTRYQIYLISANKIGVSQSSSVLTAKTKGLAPEVPPKDKLLQENSTYIVLSLDTWTSGGCPILYFVVEYKESEQETWTLVSNNVKPLQDRFPILDLKPGTWYNLRVTAHNSAGSGVAEYDFFTLTSYGGTVPSMMASDQDVFSFALNPNVLMSVVASILIVVTTVVVVCFCVRRQRHLELHQEKPGNAKPMATAKFQAINQDGKPTHEKGSFTLLLSNSNDAILRQNYGSEKLSKNNVTGLQSDDNICPYATVRIPGCREQDLLAHAPSQYHNYSPRNSIAEYKPHGQQSLLYSKVQKQLLQQHPQSPPLQQQHEDYVTPGSESDLSDTEVAQYSESYGPMQELPPAMPIRLEHRVPDLLYHRPGSSSTETSPDAAEHHSYQRPGRTRNRLKHPKPNLVAGNRSSSADSVDEGTPFSFDHYTDTHQLELGVHEDPLPQGYLDGGWGHLSDLKSKQYSSPPINREEATLLMRRFQNAPPTQLMHTHELSEDYTIAV